MIESHITKINVDFLKVMKDLIYRRLIVVDKISHEGDDLTT